MPVKYPVKSQKKQHGGYREGSGRKPLGVVRIEIRLKPETIKSISERGSVSTEIRRILETHERSLA